MDTRDNDKLDALIMQAAAECAEKDASALDSVATKGVKLSRRAKKRILKQITQTEEPPTTTRISAKLFFRIAAALIALLALGILGVMAATDTEKDTFFSATLEDKGGRFSLNFEPVQSTEDEPVPPPPTTIETSRKPSYILEGFEEEVLCNFRTSAAIVYTLDRQTEYFYMQMTLDEHATYIDNTDAEVQEIKLNGYDAKLIITQGGEIKTIVWSDNEYAYLIMSSGSKITIDDLVKVAASVK